MADDYEPNEFVTMTHPDIEAPSGLTTRQAFEEVHKPKGWVLAEAPAEAAPSEATGAESEGDSAAKGRKRS